MLLRLGPRERNMKSRKELQQDLGSLLEQLQSDEAIAVIVAKVTEKVEKVELPESYISMAVGYFENLGCYREARFIALKGGMPERAGQLAEDCPQVCGDAEKGDAEFNFLKSRKKLLGNQAEWLQIAGYNAYQHGNFERAKKKGVEALDRCERLGDYSPSFGEDWMKKLFPEKVRLYNSIRVLLDNISASVG